MESSPLFTGFIINVLCDPYSFTQPAFFTFMPSKIQGELACEGNIVSSSYLMPADTSFCFNLQKVAALVPITMNLQLRFFRFKARYLAVRVII
ncbi:hypothetical protein FXV91_12450 [Methanosarcina sp. DH2]|uniref:hypothetical protein n=1 Tax=Methanosarcina sp. DH2 TaxID=2605639 RepID=UPI001E49C02C|nr:hypothetical protein [Methanosarcina sp. DH2]MCC4770951.1 hypothetical protein [Methanosarcina sp. DH2]